MSQRRARSSPASFKMGGHGSTRWKRMDSCAPTAFRSPRSPSPRRRTRLRPQPALFLAEGGTVAVKVSSSDIIHKSDVGGGKLDLTSEAAVRRAALDIFERAKRLKPDARITGVTVQPMVRHPKARELIAGLADDPTFGPVVAFGRGGTAVEVINDKALALPPLDMKLAEMLIARTRVSRI